MMEFCWSLDGHGTLKLVGQPVYIDYVRAPGNGYAFVPRFDLYGISDRNVVQPRYETLADAKDETQRRVSEFIEIGLLLVPNAVAKAA